MMNPIFIRKWVSPYYLNILNGNYCRLLTEEEQGRFIANVREALPKLTDKTLAKLINGHWRYAITGSWFAGVLGARQHQERIGARLLASETCYAGQGHAFALACFADDASRDFLKRYLDTYLKKPECFYDQHWAMPALMWVDELSGSSDAQAYLAPGGLWDQWTQANESCNLDRCQSHFWSCMKFVHAHFRQDGSHATQ